MVKSLVCYAYKALHGDVMLQLWQRSLESNEENQIKLDSADRVMSVSDIKAQLDEYLVGRYSQFRYQLWDDYFCSCGKEEPNRPDLFTLLECIVDYNFTDLNFFPIPLPSDAMTVDGQFYLTKIINLLAERCPKLHELSLRHLPQWKLTPDVEAAYSQSFSGLKNLTQLQLCEVSLSDNGLQFFKHLGNSCPNLKSLRLIEHTLTIGMKQLLALVLGEEVDQFLQKFIAEEKDPENNLHLLQLPEDLVTPICRSLTKLELLYKPYDFEQNFEEKAYASGMAFILRNFPHLECLQVKYNLPLPDMHLVVSRGIQLLYESPAQPPRKIKMMTYLKVHLTYFCTHFYRGAKVGETQEFGSCGCSQCQNVGGRSFALS